MPMLAGSAVANAGLAGEIKAQVQANNPDLLVTNTSDEGEVTTNDMDWLWDSIATAVINHIKANMLVVTVVSVTGSATAQAGAGTTISPPGSIS